MLLLTDQSHYGKGQGQGVEQGNPGPNSQDQMESKESEEEDSENNSFMGKLKRFFGAGKKKDDTNRIVGLGIPSFDLVTAGADWPVRTCIRFREERRLS